MRFDEYQLAASKHKTNFLSVHTESLSSTSQDLCELAFEVQRNNIRDMGDLKRCLGEILFQVSSIATEFNLSMGSIADASLEAKRKQNV